MPRPCGHRPAIPAVVMPAEWKAERKSAAGYGQGSLPSLPGRRPTAFKSSIRSACAHEIAPASSRGSAKKIAFARTNSIGHPLTHGK